MADLYQSMSTLRAVRRLRPDPIPADVLERVLQAACWAPTGGNQQPWRIVAVTDADKKHQLAQLYKPEWEDYSVGFLKRIEGQPADMVQKWGRVLKAGDYLADHMHEAPVLLVFCADFRSMAVTDANLNRISLVGGGSVYPAVQNAMLACVSEGLGCVLTTLLCIREREVKEALSIPDPWVTAGVVPIGYPVNRGHGPITRKPPAAMVFRDSFGQAW